VSTTNIIQPYVVRVDGDDREDALAALAADLGVPSGWASVATKALREARAAHRRTVTPGRAILAATGVAAVVLAPMLVLAAAPAGLSGGAAIVAGLAALGPGGMLGGVGVVGLVGGAGGGMAARALLAGTPAEVEETVIALQAMALAKHRLALDSSDHGEWGAVVAMFDRLADELDRHRKFSDDDSGIVKATTAKFRSVERAMRWMDDRGLSPGLLELPEVDDN
jgi:hypothetical protein